MNKEKKELYEIIKPLIELLAKKYAPETMVLVTSAGVKILNTEVELSIKYSSYGVNEKTVTELNNAESISNPKKQCY